ncbi:MAG: preprotein translocase subunit YajC [Acidimicrobiales bacterium]
MAFISGTPHIVLVAAAKSTTTTSTGSGSYFFLILIALMAGFYFLRIRPRQQQRMQAMRQARAFDVGDEVVAGGMVGHVTEIGDGEVEVEVSDGVVVRFVPQAVQSRAAYAAAAAGRGRFGAPPPPPPRRQSTSYQDDQGALDSNVWPSTDSDVDSDPGTDGPGGDGGAAPGSGAR